MKAKVHLSTVNVTHMKTEETHREMIESLILAFIQISSQQESQLLEL